MAVTSTVPILSLAIANGPVQVPVLSGDPKSASNKLTVLVLTTPVSQISISPLLPASLIGAMSTVTLKRSTLSHGESIVVA